MSKKKGYFSPPVIIFLALLLLLVALTLYFNAGLIRSTAPQVSPSPQTTSAQIVYTDEGSANWKTYTSKEYSFSFKYPENAELKIDKNILDIKDGIEVWLTVDQFTIFFTARPNKNNLTLDNPKELFNNGPFTTDLGDETLKETKLDNQMSYLGENCCINGEFRFWALKQIATVKDQKVYEIRVETKDHKNKYSKLQIDEDLLNQILSTFKFTN